MLSILDLLFPPRRDELAIRHVGTDDLLALLAPRLVDYTRPGTVALLSFGNPQVRSAIHEAKYHGSAHAFTILGGALAEYLREADDVGRSTSNVVLVPVPLGAERLQARGFNQVHEVLKRTTRELKLAIDATLLTRTRETTSQVTLPREKREANMRGAFACPAKGATRPLDATYTYIVVDDVVTTGATLQAAVDALTSAGATHIIPLAFAH